MSNGRTVKEGAKALALAAVIALSSPLGMSVWAAQNQGGNPEITKDSTKTSVKALADGVEINGTKETYEMQLQLADPKADASVLALYQYLKAVGSSDGVLYGHMEDTLLKAGAENLSESDTKDVTGSLSAIVGFDCGGAFSGYASKYNERHMGEQLPDDCEGNLTAAARFSNEAIDQGAVVTLSSHMPNFSAAKKLEGSFAHTYDAFDFSGGDSYNLTGECMNQILPGGAYNEAFRAHLDLIADYISQVKGPVLLRPFHENTGSWFWWGRAFCDAETYKSVYKYTVEYLRDEKGLHNILYLYSPGGEASTVEEYGERYPGDAYVDLIGFDTYDTDPVPDEEGYTFQDSLKKLMKVTDTFAKQHGKLFAITETGVSSSEGGALLKTGNKRPDWFCEILDIASDPEYDCCYFMLWSNYSSSNFYTPYVEKVNADGSLCGHELLDSFIRLYSDRRSIFANDQAELLRTQRDGTNSPTVRGIDRLGGYITSPLAGKRVLEETKIAARLNQEVEKAEFRISGGSKEVVLKASVNGKKAEAFLDAETLAQIGEAADGKLTLCAEGEELQTIPLLYNIQPMSDNPLLVDDFESYAGLDSLLCGSWAINKESSCKLQIGLTNAYSEDGGYALKFDYTETKNGWAGCEFSKEADWSECDALQLWVIPDGKNQKTVVQIKTADGGAYEAYLQEYPEYAEASGPLLATIPFKDFVDKGERGSLTEEAAENISGLGLWVNAISDSPAMKENTTVSGTLYYDKIRAVKSGSEKAVFEAAGTDAEANREIKEEVESSTSSSWTRYMAPVAVLLAGGVSLAAGRRKRGEGRK